MKSHFALAALALLFSVGPVLAADGCKPQLEINTVDLVMRPNRVLVPVSINGLPKLFVLDTGGFTTQVTANLVSELKLPKTDTGTNGERIYDLYGHASDGVATIAEFQFGRLKGKDMEAMISALPDFGDGDQVVGLLAPDVMETYDVELDFSAAKLNYFSQQHCPGHVIYWPHTALAIDPITLRDQKISVPVKLDATEIPAVIDTGAHTTLINAAYAKRLFGIGPDSPGNQPINSRSMPGAFVHTFSALDFEGVAIRNARIVVYPDQLGTKDPNNGFQTGSRTQRVTDDINTDRLIIGMDILKYLHLYIAFNEQKLYITEASTPAAAANATQK